MLLEFKAKNYKSYKNDMIFSMTRAPRIRDLSYSILKEKVGKLSFDALCSSVIYGPNAAGKSNILDAMEVFKRIVTSGNIRNEMQPHDITSRSNLELIPFMFDNNKNVLFSIKFVEDNILFEYSLDIDIGNFLSKNYNREILNEILKINDEIVFERNNIELKAINITNKLKDEFVDNINTVQIQKMFSETLIKDELFLTNGFKNLSKNISQNIIDWFSNKFIIIKQLDKLNAIPYIEDQKFYIDNFVNDIAKQSGITGTDILYYKDEKKTNIVSMVKKYSENNQLVMIPYQIIESYGTQRIIQLMPIILSVLKSGATLAIDELDAALHPMVIMNIINIFHNDEININHAQLIFNTHNPIYLNNSIFRRDEIKFVERDENTHISTNYALSDFGTKGSNSVRNTTDYIKNYFMNKYGAIVNLDYSEIFKSFIDRKED